VAGAEVLSAPQGGDVAGHIVDAHHRCTLISDALMDLDAHLVSVLGGFDAMDQTEEPFSACAHEHRPSA
jgi:hypothetical protein